METKSASKPSAPQQIRKVVDFSPAAMARPAASPGTLKSLFESPEILQRISAVVPKHVTPERLAKVFLSAIIKTPDLLKCSQASLVQSVIQLSELGLDPAGGLGFAYLVPFKTKTGAVLAQAIVGYRGYIELARRSGQLSSVRARVVHKKDVFKVRYGMVEDLEHIPSDEPEPGPMTHVYCVAEFKDGGRHMEVMSRAQVDAIRAKAPGGNSPAWKDHYEAMAQKTVIRKASHFWPLSPEIGRALEVDESTDVNPDPFDRGGGKGNGFAGAFATAPESAEYTDFTPVATEDSPPPADMNPETGEVPFEGEAPQRDDADPEPFDASSTEHLLWKIRRASKDELEQLTAAAGKLEKTDPLRGQVGSAISKRRTEVAQ